MPLGLGEKALEPVAAPGLFGYLVHSGRATEGGPSQTSKAKVMFSDSSMGTSEVIKSHSHVFRAKIHSPAPSATHLGWCPKILFLVCLWDFTSPSSTLDT
ncbi:hypothetical protein NW765_009003 [Fusarium oxysporum]|nr:hypothetical protein NW765_009003 [Fusarium oxysporum]KAJ4274067.1 hypothetical protein NW764_011920 [Fusarium oxysporum]